MKLSSKLSDRGAFIACGQLSTYSKALHADRFIVLVGIAEHDGAIAIIESNDVNGTDVELEIYSPADDRQLNPEPSDNYDHEPAYAAAYSGSYKAEELSPGMIGFGIVVVIVLGFLGMIGNSTSGGNSGPVQRVSNPDVVRAGSALVVTPETVIVSHFAHSQIRTVNLLTVFLPTHSLEQLPMNKTGGCWFRAALMVTVGSGMKVLLFGSLNISWQN